MAERTRVSIQSHSTPFKIVSENKPQGDQPKAISEIVNNLNQGIKRQTLLGVTGSGKTFTIANVIEQLNRPALVLAHNKTLAAQLYSEFKELFPNNAVSYFVSFYDYYQPEAYVPSTDTYIEKDSSINDEIDKLRHLATRSLIERRDAIVVASVSCIYGLGDPESYLEMMFSLHKNMKIEPKILLRHLVELQFERNDYNIQPGTFKARGDCVDICLPSESETIIRVELFGGEIELIVEIDRLTGNKLREIDKVFIYPASHYVTNSEKQKNAIKSIREELEYRLKELEQQGKLLEAQRLEQRTIFDLELLQEMGFCPGIENYSRHLTGRSEGEPPPTLLDYFSDDFLTFIDESHVTVSQIGGMYRGDRARKQTLVDHGFRLPSALDNRPLKFDEFQSRVGQVVFVSATPAKHELEESGEHVIEQIIRPTGLIDPQVIIRPARDQVDDLLNEIHPVIERGERILITTLTKKMAEHLSSYYQGLKLKVKYLHSEIHTLDRIDLIRGLRKGEFDILVGINLLREGLDLPEVSLVGILDADKEGFLRSETSLIQTIGRAARNINGRVILYADNITGSIDRAIKETERRRRIQLEYNKQNNITPVSTKRALEVEMIDMENLVEEIAHDMGYVPKSERELKELIGKLRSEMLEHASKQEFEKALVLRDRIINLEKLILKG